MRDACSVCGKTVERNPKSRPQITCHECRRAGHGPPRSPRSPKCEPLHPCGTWGAYARHLRRGEKPCEACQAAQREYTHGRRGVPCRECGQRRYISGSSLAEPLCHECRRRLNPAKPPWVPSLVACPCGVMFEQCRYGQKYCCPGHRPDPNRTWRSKWKLPPGWRQLRLRVFAAHGRACYRCGAYATTVDHAVPVALGGGHDLSNLRPACFRCNASTGASMGNRLRRGNLMRAARSAS